MMRRKTSSAAAVITSLVLFAGGLVPAGTAFSSESTASRGDHRDARFEIRLKSRSFIPKEGISKSLLRGRTFGVIQFYELPTPEQHRTIRDAGIIFRDCFSGNSYGAYLSRPLRERQLAALGVRSLFPLRATDRVSRAVFRGPPDRADAGQGRVDVVVTYFPEFDRAAAVIRDLGGSILTRSEFFETITVRATRGTVNRIAHNGWVRWIEPVASPPVLFNSDSRASINVDEIQEAPFNLTGAGVRLGIWDEGEVSDHADFAGRLTLMDNSQVSDHSTHVAGTMAGDGSLSGGFYRGMAPAAEIYSWDAGPDAQEEMLAGAMNQGISVSQNSWGDFPMFCEGYGEYGARSRFMDQLVAYKNLHVIFAAGNWREQKYLPLISQCGFGAGFGAMTAPATGKNVITVGGLGKDESMGEYSAWGPLIDGRVKPDVVTIGGTRVGADCVDGVTSTVPGDAYDNSIACGTSMAAPAVSGTAGLLIERYRQEPYVIDPTATPPPDLVKALLMNTATDMGNPGPDYKFGYGKVNALAAVEALDERAWRRGVNWQGDVRDHRIVVELNPAATCDIKIMLLWSDEPAAGNAADALVNDLDLVVIDPNFNSFLPLTLDPGDPDADAAPGGNSRDNVEQVVFSTTTPGNWTIRVSGDVCSPNGQPYVITWVGEGCQISTGPEM
jgi:hypothetical protein